MRPTTRRRSSFAYLTHGDRQRLDNLLMRHGNNTLAVYLNDPVANANAATLGYAASHQAADLRGEERLFTRAGAGGRTAAALGPWITRHTHDAVLHAETKLELEIGSLDEDSGDGRAAHNAELHLHLVLQTLDHKQQQQRPWLTRWLGVKISLCEFGGQQEDGPGPTEGGPGSTGRRRLVLWRCLIGPIP